METAIKLPTQEFLLECFIYNKVTGSLVWKVRPLHHFKNAHGMNTFNSKYSGKKITSQVNGRYFVVRLAGRHYLSHRVIWKMMTGLDPAMNIDHIDTNKKNNSWSNLRLATKQENAFNQGASPRNKTGFKGVSYDSTRDAFYACIQIEGKTKSLGRFSTPEQAHLAYVEAAKAAHGNFFRSNA